MKFQTCLDDSGVESGDSEQGDSILTAESWMWNTDWSSSKLSICGVCMESSESVTSIRSCGHAFCLDCWESHVRAKVSRGSHLIRCMESGCDVQIDWGTLAGIIPAGLLDRLENLLADAFLLRNRSRFAYCPNESCSRLHEVVSNDGSSKGSLCVCHRAFCRLCTEPPHWPVDCELAATYRAQLILNGDDRLRVEGDERRVKVKRCPYCSTQMEKGEGCNHMQCRCGNAFCWGCGGKWEQNNVNHYNCGTKSHQNFESVVLVDVPKSGLRVGNGMLKRAAYENAVVHRHINIRNRCKVALMKRGRGFTVSNKACQELRAKNITAQAFMEQLYALSFAAHSAMEWWEVWRFANPRKVTVSLASLASNVGFVLLRLDDRMNSLRLSLDDIRILGALQADLRRILRHFGRCLTVAAQ